MALAASKQSEFEIQLEKGVAELGLGLSRDAQVKLLQHIALLDKWNRVYNLTAIRDRTKAISVHLLDSLAVVPYLTGRRVLDVGSGAGFPGIPVAVAKPGIEMVLLDSNHKKCAFLRKAVAELQLKNVSVVCERVESWRPEVRFDCILSRALAELAEIVALTANLLAPRGIIAAMKGIFPFEEIERIPPEYHVHRVQTLAVPGLSAERHLVLIGHA
jgi:16S rRNA (guanine527-N7)-methyltransferase